MCRIKFIARRPNELSDASWSLSQTQSRSRVPSIGDECSLADPSLELHGTVHRVIHMLEQPDLDYGDTIDVVIYMDVTSETFTALAQHASWKRD